MMMNDQANSSTSASNKAMVIRLCVYMEGQTIGLSTGNIFAFWHQESKFLSVGESGMEIHLEHSIVLWHALPGAQGWSYQGLDSCTNSKICPNTWE